MSWREIQKTNFKRLKDLALFLNLELQESSHMPLNVPRRLAEKMPKGTLEDPITRQFVPLPNPPSDPLGFCQDPVKDRSFCRSGKLLHKYKGRALLLSTSACAMHCRYCLRQHFPYATHSKFEEELALIQGDPSLFEIILSGGDPLSLSNRTLSDLLASLNQIEHIQLIRLHTRFPIGIPERIDRGLLELFAQSHKPITFLIHANHVRELDADVLAALKQIQHLGIPILIQTVLLKGVNDSVAALKELFLCCIKGGIIPYYLHQLDQVEGACHFKVDPDLGRSMIRELRCQLPGYAVPRYVQEVPGQPGKTHLI